MEEACPSIARPIVFNKRNNRGKGKIIAIDELCSEPTPHPTLVVPIGSDGSVGHCVAVVDDILFDSTQTTAMKLTKKSFDWIVNCEGGCIGLGTVIRFNSKYVRKVKSFKRKLVTHW